MSNKCTTCKTPLLAAYCGHHEPSKLIRIVKRISGRWTTFRFLFMNRHTVDLDSPTWREELDNIKEDKA